jgi:hypothetical protein
MTARVRRASTTRHVLWRLLTGLLVLTVVVFGTTLWTFHRLHATAETVRTHSAPAVLGLTLARAALVKADHAVITSFGTDESMLVGPGADHQNQIAIASQSLTQVAEHNVAGDAGSRTLQLVNGLLVSYTNLVGQADVHYRQGGSRLGTTYLWYASRLLHTPHSGLLAQLDLLLDTHEQVLERQLGASAVTVWTVLLWGVPIAGLFVLLVVAQVVLRRRFRRTWNPWLSLATVLLVGLLGVASLVFVSDGRLDESRDALHRAVSDRQAQTSATDSGGQQDLLQFVDRICEQPGRCGETITRFRAEVESAETEGGVDDGRLAAAAQKVSERTEAARATAGYEFLIYVLAALIGLSVLFGFRRRIDEYRYRPR